MKSWFFLLATTLLAACSTSPPAPVIERAPVAQKPAPPQPAPPKEKDWRPDVYTVKKGDTLYSIGLEYGYDYKEIAQRNNIQPPYLIRIGQKLKLKESGKEASPPTQPAGQDSQDVVVTPLKIDGDTAPRPLDEPPLLSEPKALKEPYSDQAMAAKPVEPRATAKPKENKPASIPKSDTAKPETTAEKTTALPDDEALEWAWPANGKIIGNFNETASAKGIDIAGILGQPVLAAAPGKVVYSGTGLRGYGKLVIIKHNKTYLSAYAHNSQIVVKEGQEVTKGQKIAEMGSTDADRVKLHFQIRKLGKPVDPTKYLPPA